MSTRLRSSLFYLFLAAAIAAQGAFWWKTHRIHPDIGIVPDVPSVETVKALSFGDDEALFRYLALGIQNAGDTFGRFTALYKYDYFKLYHWMRLLDTLDDQSNYLPSMATYYFGQTQRKGDVKYIYDYLVEHAAHRPKEKWWWLVQASYIANHKLNDIDLAFKAAKPLENTRGIPLWAQQMPAFLYEQQGEMGAAMKIIEAIMENEDEIGQGELNFMHYFVKDRLAKLEEMEEVFHERQKTLNEKKQAEGENTNSDPAPVPELQIESE